MNKGKLGFSHGVDC